MGSIGSAMKGVFCMRGPIFSLTVVIASQMALALDGAPPKDSDHGKSTGPGTFRKGSDILMKDLRWPGWDRGTYYMVFNSGFTPAKPKKAPMYGGCRTRNGPPRGWFCTFFGTMTGAGIGRHFGGGGSGGRGVEGSGGGFKGAMREFKANQWYRVVMRTYNPKRKDKIGKEGYWGWWMKDVHNGIWYYCGTANLMSPVTGFNRGGGMPLPESMTGGKLHQRIDGRFIFGRIDGKWYKINKFGNRNGKIRLVENDTVSSYDSEYKGSVLPEERCIRKSPDRPQFDPIVIEKAAAAGYGKQVSVSWSVPETSSPQLGHRIEVFAQAGARGKPILVNEENTSWIYGRRFDLSARARSVRLTVIDIFDREESVVIPVESTRPTPAERVAGRTITQGLLFELYLKPKSKEKWWTMLPDLSGLKPARQGHVSGLSTAPKAGAVDRNTSSAFKYSGYIKAPADGLYMLQAGTKDGNKVRIDGKVVLNDDGCHLHAPNPVPVALSKGLHSFNLEFFAQTKSVVKFQWEGPGFELRSMGREDFLCDNAGGVPDVAIEVKSPMVDEVLQDNLAELHVNTSLGGHKLNYLDLMVGGKAVHTSSELDKDGKCVFKLLLPRGSHEYWVRMLYDDDQYCMSREMMTINVKEHLDGGGWKFEYKDFGIEQPASARYKDGEFSFMGQGQYDASRSISGDFTITGRIAEIATMAKYGNLMAPGWIGVYTGGGGYYAFFLDTRDRGWRTVPNTRDLGSSGMSNELPFRDKAQSRTNRWMRLERQGHRISVYSSLDGKEWEKVAERLAKGFAKDPRRVGFYMKSKIRGGTKPMVYGTVDNVTVENSAMPLPQPTRPSGTELSLKNRITGVVQCIGKPGTLYARSPTRGVLVSNDRGETWKDANGNLKSTPEAMACRSIAVHSENPRTVLRGGGAVVGGKLKSGLWKTVDGGRTWKLVCDGIDFDGTGPTALFGEVISIGRKSGARDFRHVAVAGGESNGLFVSHDTGDTWKLIDHKHSTKLFVDERITAVRFAQLPSANGGDLNTLMVGTFADSEFEKFGLGKPHVNTAKGESGCVISGRIRNMPNKEGFVASGFRGERLPAFGVTDVTVDKHYNFWAVATTRGVYYHFPGGALDQLRHNMPSDCLNVALGFEYVPVPNRRKKGALEPQLRGYTAPFSLKGANHIYDSTGGANGGFGKGTEARLVGAPAGAHVSSGLTCLLPDVEDNRIRFFCNTYGIFKSTDEGRTFRLVCGSKARAD